MLTKMPNTNSETQYFATFDWDLQILLIKLSGNSIARMIYNDLSELYHTQVLFYFDKEETKAKSLQYYSALKNAIPNDKEVQDLNIMIDWLGLSLYGMLVVLFGGLGIMLGITYDDFRHR